MPEPQIMFISMVNPHVKQTDAVRNIIMVFQLPCIGDYHNPIPSIKFNSLVAWFHAGYSPIIL